MPTNRSIMQLTALRIILERHKAIGTLAPVSLGRLMLVGVAAAVEGHYLAPFGFDHFAVALLITVLLAIG